MDNNYLTTLAILFIFIGGIFIPLGLFLAYASRLSSNREKIVERILARKDRLPRYLTYFPVRHASESWFKKIMKVFPWHSAGLVFILADGQCLYEGELCCGDGEVSVGFRPQDVRWLGRSPWPNGAIAWIEIQTPQGKHYLSSETGMFLFVTTIKSTRAIYDRIKGSAKARSS